MMDPMHDDLTAAIARDLGIDALPKEEQEKLIAQFGEVALKAAAVAVASRLAAEKRAQFEETARTGDAAALKAFLDRELPDHEAIAQSAVAEEVRRFKGAAAA